VRVAKSAVRAALAARHPGVRDWAALRTVRVTERTSYGRPVWVEAVSRGGKSLRIRAEALRMALLRAGVASGLYSMNCRLDDAGASIVFRDGRGFGHGVGLSQWGAQAKARRGASAEDILQFYYPGARIFRAY